MKFNLDEVVSKIGKIQKYNSNKYHRESKRASKVSFKEILQNKLEEDLDDRHYYDKFNIKDPNSKFGNEPLRKYKANNKANYFPPLDAPLKVRNAWRHIIETCPNEKREALRFLTIILCDTTQDKNNHIKTDQIHGYNTLCILLINRFKNILEFKDNPSVEFYLKLLVSFNHLLSTKDSIKTAGIDDYI